MSFDEAVRNVRFDLARAEGGSFHLFFFLNGYRDGELVDTAATILGDVGAWQEVALVEEVDYIEWWSVGDVRYAVDGLGWDGMAPAVVAVEIDLMPGSERNPIRLGRPGVVPVVLRGSPGLDVGEVVLESLGFGAEPALAVPSRRPAQAVVDDLDGDGWLDLLLHPRVEEMDLLQGDDRVCLVGELSDGGFIEGCDAVTLVGARRR